MLTPANVGANAGQIKALLDPENETQLTLDEVKEVLK